MFDPIVDGNSTITGAAKASEDTKKYAQLGKAVADQDKFMKQAAPLVQEARIAGAQELMQRIESQRAQAAQLAAQQGSYGLADYTNQTRGWDA